MKQTRELTATMVGGLLCMTVGFAGAAGRQLSSISFVEMLLNT